MLQTPIPSPRHVRALVDRVRADLATITAAVADGVLLEVADEALPELTTDLLAASDAAQAAATIAVGRTQASGVLRARGVVSTKTWLKNTTRCGDREAARLLARSRDLDRPELAPTRDAWLTGQAVSGQVREICTGLSACERKTRDDADLTALVFGDGQSALLGLAGSENADRVRDAGCRILATVFPDGASADEQEAFHDQVLALRRVGSECDVRGLLDLEGEALLTTALDRIVDSWYRDGTLAPAPVLDPGTGQIDPDTTNAAIAAAEAGQTHGVARTKLEHLRDPALVPVSTIARLGCDADVTLARTTALDAQPRGRDGLALLPADGNLLCELASTLRDQTREVLWLGREHRHVTARLWRLLALRDKHCRFPGCCHADLSRCHPHHVLEWWHGGETDPANPILLCGRHHRMVHTDRWRIIAEPGISPLSPDY